jgi:hypothetical protein
LEVAHNISIVGALPDLTEGGAISNAATEVLGRYGNLPLRP